MFMAGSFSLWYEESFQLTHSDLAELPHDTQVSWDQQIKILDHEAGGGRPLRIRFPTPLKPVGDLFAFLEDGSRIHKWVIPSTGECRVAPPRAIDYAFFIVDVHYFGFFKAGSRVSGILAGFFFILIGTGTLYQW